MEVLKLEGAKMKVFLGLVLKNNWKLGLNVTALEDWGRFCKFLDWPSYARAHSDSAESLIVPKAGSDAPNENQTNLGPETFF